MTTAELIKTLADLGYGQFTTPIDRMKLLPKLSRDAKSALRMADVFVSNGSTMVCVTIREDMAVYFAESASGWRAEYTLAAALSGVGVEPSKPASSPTLEAVGAEVAPKGLQVLTLTEPVWFSEWLLQWQGYFLRKLLVPSLLRPPSVYEASVHKSAMDLTWSFMCERIAGENIKGQGHPTPEAAQAACEAAIVAAWRNR